MTVDTNIYRARIGNFHIRAAALGRKLAFLDQSTIIPFFTLISSNCSDRLVFATFVYFCLQYTFSTQDLHLRLACKTKPISCNKSGSLSDHPAKQNRMFFNLYKQILLFISGDVERNPGPPLEKGLCVVHVNARSLGKKLDLLEAESENFDIITLSETWLSKKDDNNDLRLTNFHSPVRQDRADDPHGGVANNLHCKPRPDLHVNNLEAVWVETKLNQENLLVGSFYRPPNAKTEYWDLISESIQKVNNTMTKYIILGDFNTDFFDNPSKHLLNILNMYQLHQLINSPTRITETTSSCLDLIITQSPRIVKYTDILPSFCSDHSVPCAVLQQPKHHSHRFKRTIYNYEKLDKNKFCSLLQGQNWEDIFETRSSDESACMFTQVFMDSAQECMPVKTVRVRTDDAPWMTNEIRLLIKQRGKMHKKAKRSNLKADWDNFRTFRNNVISKVRKRKLDYFDELTEKISNQERFGSKDWWKLVKSILRKKGIGPEEIPPLCKNGTVIYANKEKADTLNEFFIEQATLENEDDPLPQVTFLDCEINDIKLTEFEVKEIINNLNTKKATGPDLIHNRLLIAANDVTSVHLTRFFNRCLNESVFPSIWKTAAVTPVLKKGDATLCNNYRPISLLSCVGKALERCVHRHIYRFLMLNNIITPSQSGFLPGESTTSQLLCIYENLCSNFDKRITTQSVYFDISKAFDRVWHRGLLLKLESIGVRGKLLKWFQNYLTDRTQAVVIKGEKSSEKKIPAGVPQGSVLGPLLFLIFINDIGHSIESIIKLFADDTSMSLGLTNPDTRAEILTCDLVKISDWAKLWKVKFNEEKTELVNIKCDTKPIHQLTFGNVVLEDKPHHKHLGITLQNNCKWDEHISNISSKVNMLINCLRHFKYKLGRKALEIMYKSFILPLFDYADIIWDNCTNTQSNMLENLHLEAIRIITGSVRGTSHQKLYNESGFCTLKERRKRHKLIQFHKMINNTCPDYLSDLLPPLVSTTNPYHRRRPYERIIPSFRTELYRNSFFPSTTLLWNNLPVNIQESSSLSEFKRYLTNNDTKVPSYYYSGQRMEQIIHCRLRLQMSDLNFDLFNRHLTENQSCACGHPFETAEHFLLLCPNYHDIRRDTLMQIEDNYLDIQILLFGNRSLGTHQNEFIFKKVHEFIRRTRRF